MWPPLLEKGENVNRGHLIGVKSQFHILVTRSDSIVTSPSGWCARKVIARAASSFSFSVSSFTMLNISRSPGRASNGVSDEFNHLSITSRCHCNSKHLGMSFL
jgi:hypothetical protein